MILKNESGWEKGGEGKEGAGNGRTRGEGVHEKKKKKRAQKCKI